MIKKTALILATMILTSCTCALQIPAEHVSNVILPEYERYVEADTTLTPIQVVRRLNAIKSFQEAVQAQK